MLLHEETYRPADKPRKARLSRHYYDLWSLIQKGVAETAMADAELFERVAAHRGTYFRITWVDYSTLRRGSLQLIPPENQVADCRGDYKAKSTEMFFETPPNLMKSSALSAISNATSIEIGNRRGRLRALCCC